MKYFIHVPKAGGTSVSKILPGGWVYAEHRSPTRVNADPKDCLGTVRNPYDRAISLYAQYLWFKHEDHVVFDTDDLIEFWQAASPIGAGLYFNRPMVNIIEDGMDILRYENLADEVKSYFGVDLPHENKSCRIKDYRYYYDEDGVLYDLITKRYQADIDKFGYVF